MSSRLTLVSTCKPFLGRSVRIQRNALASWAAMVPRPEVIVAGDEEGVAKACAELGHRHVPKLERTEAGTPLLPSLLELAERAGAGDWLGLVNADIVLVRGLEEAVARVSEHFDRFLLIARRWNLQVDEDLDFRESGWEARLEARAVEKGVLEPRFGGADLFVFPRGAWGAEPLPPYAVGRGRWDSALVYEARRRGLPVVDATEAVFNVHQDHDYSHHPQATVGVFKGPEAVENEALLGGAEFIFSPLNATHLLGKDGVRRNRVWNPLLLARRLGTLPAEYPVLRPLAGLVRRAAPLWRLGRRVWNRLVRGLASRAPRRGSPQSRAPYPVELDARLRYSPELPPGGGVEDFDKQEAVHLNRARMEHLAGLGLPLEGRRVLDVGSGPGHLAQFFQERGCSVLCLEGRAENVAQMEKLYPGLEGRVFDVEEGDFTAAGRFDVVFSYGLLYHTENPWRVIQGMASVCDDILLLSTIIADHDAPLVVMEEETAAYTQALRHVGCRPTPAYVTMALRAGGFPHVYAPVEPPQHPDFQVRWKRNLEAARDGHPLRAMFVASRQPLANDRLVPLLREA